jgi:hypothetical protein
MGDDMRFNIPRSIMAKFVFIAGLLLMVVGVTFLLGSLNNVSKKYVLLAFLFVIIGASIAIFAIKLNKRALYLFFAGFFILVGFFLFLSALNIFPFPFSKAWPLISVFSGLALIPAGWRKYGVLRSNFIVPSLAFIVLGTVLLVFSFHIVPFNFKQFILNWWPMLIVLTGLLLVLLTLGTKNSKEDIKQ